MGMVVQHNMNAINAYNRLNVNVSGMKKASEKLSSGYRINRAGDDAAGLAISEKMRSQIRGLGQAKRNAQDGISMIQTFEGAAQETHSILQRMKELATESANGTYDNATDRAAIQLEFDQLNDELNQIADTDFNGTIVLNGGVMADGLREENGEFNYANLDAQLKADNAKVAIDLVASNDYSKKAPSLTDNTYLASDTKLTATDAGCGKLWAKAIEDGVASAKDTEIYVRYTIDGVDDNGKVTAYKADYVDKKGNSLKEYGGTVTLTSNGGVKDGLTGTTVVTDTITGKKGDFFTVKYTRPENLEQAPTNIGFEDATGTTGGVTSSGWKANSTLQNQALKNTKIELHADVSDTNWTGTDKAIYQEAIKQLDGAKIEIGTFTNAGTAGTTALVPTGAKLTAAGETTATTLATNATGGWGYAAAPTGNTFTLQYKGKNIATITYDVKADGTGTETGNIFLTVAVDGYRGAAAEKPDATLVPADATKIDKTVSQANAFTQSTARMTYAKNITLQTGARTKDAVNFTFNYNADGTADMGTLKNNLDLSSRANGLNTAGLSLATAKEANHAIDQIDKAINKTSMVRASFGAIQNRLEHKIDNLTTTNENLTEAESNIRDTDMASEMMNYTKFNILQQAAQSMLAQANQQPQSILQLLG